MDIEKLSDEELNAKYQKIRKVTAFGLDFINLSREIERRKEKAIADGYRAEFSALSDDVILNFVASIGDDRFVKLTEHVESESLKFIESQPF